MTKRGRLGKKAQISLDSPRFEINADADLKVLKVLLSKIKKKYNISSTDLLNISKEEQLIPCSIFNSILSPLETDVKYMKENLNLSFGDMGELLGRNRKTVWQAYKNASGKQPQLFNVKETKYNIPVSVLHTELSILEASVVYLKDHHGLSYHDIGEILKRNERTIWTVYNRAMKKNGQ